MTHSPEIQAMIVKAQEVARKQFTKKYGATYSLEEARKVLKRHGLDSIHYDGSSQMYAFNEESPRKEMVGISKRGKISTYDVMTFLGY